MTLVANVMEDLECAHFEASAVLNPRTPHFRAPSEEVPAEQENLPRPDPDAAVSAQCIAEKIGIALRLRIGRDRHDLWFDGKTRLALAGNTLLVDAGNAFSANWIRVKFHAELHAVAREVLGRALEVRVRVGEIAAARPADGPAPADQRATMAVRSHNPAFTAAPAVTLKYTLEDFVVGPSNQLAFHAAARVAQQPGAEFNPMFIYGQCGLGKTHLLQGICRRFAELHPAKKWLYLTGEQFTNEFVEALKTKKTDPFRRRIRNADLLVLDDVHFLAHKKATQEEFLHTFNQVDARGKQVVLASDCGPRQIRSLSEQLSSRFVSGMVLRVDSPDLPTRLEILRRKVFRNGWNVADSVLMHIAQSSTSSVRELEGLLLQVVAGIRLINAGALAGHPGGGGPMGGGGPTEAGAMLATIRQRTAMRAPVPVGRIVAAAAEHFAVEPAALLQSGREKKISTVRSLAMYLARQHTGMSFPEIGRAFGNKNHSTVIAACQRVEGWLTLGKLLAWTTTAGLRHQAASDAIHELEAAIRRAQ